MEILNLPLTIRNRVEGFAFHAVGIGKSRANVFRLTHPEKKTLYLKFGEANNVAEVSAEVERLRWFAERASVPRVVAFLRQGSVEYLLTEALPGRNGVDRGAENPRLVATEIGKALRRLHVQPIDGCPFDQSISAQIERARNHTRAGLVDEEDFEPEHRGLTASELLPELTRSRSWQEAKALTHGDACLPNFMFEGGRFTGYVDCCRAGVADPYQDLALAARSIGGNFGEQWVQPFFASYGLPNPDQQKLAYYRLLDEFF